ncbi:D-3-phosphoglycerate dehydrogenase [Brevibacterium sanguinis]|uniref:D-3-phosphoglycerate dehydrogenase n=2 Tax=Brevibacterium TaxID=1696 RepID=A0A366IHS2_9MICO|nr:MULTISPECIES: phosphoglycerate dehydrogenase [Brevibacterium]RBP61992.1 D-3-phosphoglycerate dehydrogenase [Brevibacterium sanguinis]RBP70586.1 D-3-phosphoglycerate dehydrogenase [Brevibacterium celere]
MRLTVLTPSFGKLSSTPIARAAALGLELDHRTENHPKSGQTLIDALAGAEAVLVGLDTIDADVLAACPELKVVAKHGAGVDNIDLDAAAAAGVTVVNTPGANADAVADLTMGLLIMGARRIREAEDSLRAGRWEVFFGTELTGKQLGILGFGRIGRAVARRAVGFGMRIAAYDPFVPDHAIAEAGAVPMSLAEAVAGSDFLTLHLPAGDEPLLHRELIESMPAGAGLINAARGGLVDEPALASALHEGNLSFAALDAFATEPPAADDPLLHAPNLIATPHIGAYSDIANANMGSWAVEDVVRVLQGEEPRFPVH